MEEDNEQEQEGKEGQEKEDVLNLKKIEQNVDTFEEELISAESILERLKNYIDFHGLNFLNTSTCLPNLLSLISNM